MGNSNDRDAQFQNALKLAKSVATNRAEFLAMAADLAAKFSAVEVDIETPPAALTSTAAPAPVATPQSVQANKNGLGPTGKTIQVKKAATTKKPVPAQKPAVKKVEVQCHFNKNGSCCMTTVLVDEKIADRKIFCEEHRHQCGGEGCKKIIPVVHSLCKDCKVKAAGQKAAPKPTIPSAVTDPNIGTKVKYGHGAEEGSSPTTCWFVGEDEEGNKKPCANLTENGSGLCDEHGHLCRGICGKTVNIHFDTCLKQECVEAVAAAEEKRSFKPSIVRSQKEIGAEIEKRKADERAASDRGFLEVAIADKLSSFVSDPETLKKMVDRLMKKCGDEATAQKAFTKAAINKQLAVDTDTIDESTWIYAQAAGFEDQTKFLEAVNVERRERDAKAQELAVKKQASTFGAMPPAVKKEKKDKSEGKKGKGRQRHGQEQARK